MSSPEKRITRSNSRTPVLGKRTRPAAVESPSKRASKRTRVQADVEKVPDLVEIVEKIAEPEEQVQEIELPPTPAASPSRSSRSYYAQARSLLRLSAQNQDLPLLGREIQRQQILTFLNAASDGDDFALRSGGALYISGKPGTGKTALVTNLLENGPCSSISRKAILNCATVKGIQIWEIVLNAVTGNESGVKGVRARKELEQVITSADCEPFLLVLDEIDHLSQTNLLQTLFSQASHIDSKLTLIGIANALDLAAQLSIPSDNARLQSLDFPPYQASDMVTIAKQRLLTLHADSSQTTLPLIAAPALELASRKVAANTGDLRSFLAVVRRAIELAEPQSLAEDVTLIKAPKAGPAHVLKALKSCQMSATNGNASSKLLSALALVGGLQARLALTALCIALHRQTLVKPATPTKSSPKSNQNPSVSYETAWSVYNDALRKADREDMLQTRCDWENLIDNLSSNGLVRVEIARSSSTSPQPSRISTSKPGSKSNSKPTKGGKMISLTFGVQDTTEAVRTCAVGASVEACNIAATILDVEKRYQGRKAKVWEQQDIAPSRGFNGNGLEGKEDEMIGVEQKGGREEEEF